MHGTAVSNSGSTNVSMPTPVSTSGRRPAAFRSMSNTIPDWTLQAAVSLFMIICQTSGGSALVGPDVSTLR